MNLQQMNESIQQLNCQICYVKQNFDALFEQFQRIFSNELQFQRNSQTMNISINNNINQSQYYQENNRNYEIFNFFHQSQESSHSQFQFLNVQRNQDEKRGKYNHYPQQLKEKAISLVKDGQYPAKIIAQKLHIPLKNLNRWLQLGAIRKKGGGRKIQDFQMEQNLKQWIFEKQNQNSPPTAKEIKKMAKKLINPQYHGTFKASKGWLEKFLKRNNINSLKKIFIKDEVFQNKIQIFQENQEKYENHSEFNIII